MNNKSLYHKKYLKYKKKYLNLIGGSHQSITALSDITKIDNNIIMWGDYDKDQYKKLPETELTNIKYVTCGSYHNVGLKNDNTVVTWGSNRLGQYNSPKYLNVEKLHNLKKSNFKLSDDKLSFTVDLPSKYIFETLYFKDISKNTNFSVEELSNWDNFQIALDKRLSRPIRNDEEVILYSSPDVKIGNIYRNKDGIFEISTKEQGIMVPVVNPSATGGTSLDIDVPDDATFDIKNNKSIFPITIQMITTTHTNKNFQIRFTNGYNDVIDIELIDNKLPKYESSSDNIVYLNTKYILNNLNKFGGSQNNDSYSIPNNALNRKTFKSNVPITIPEGVNNAWITETLLFDNIATVCCGSTHNVGLKKDGRAFSWGSSIYDQYKTPEDVELVDIIDIKCGQGHSVALKEDGSVITWGNNEYGQRNISNGTELINIKSIACGFNHTIGLKHDGTVVSWGNNDNGQQVFMEDVKLENIKKIFCGGFHNVAIKEDDSVIAWGSNEFDQCNLPIYGELKDVIDVACGRFHNIALKKDGTVVIWGNNMFEQDKTYDQKLENIKYIASGENHSVALKKDGRVILWGSKEKNQLNISADIKLENIQFIACGDDHTVAIQKGII
jgi:alpha-tubulin suppressor-like RCC1 family protein